MRKFGIVGLVFMGFVAGIFFVISCGGGGGGGESITPPGEDVTGRYEIRNFGFVCDGVTSAGNPTPYEGIIWDEGDVSPDWYGNMFIDKWEVKKEFYTSETYRPKFPSYMTIEDIWVIEKYYQVDGMYLLYEYGFSDYSIGNIRYGLCHKYEYWEKVSD